MHNLHNNLQKLANILPRHPKNILVIVFNLRNASNASKELKVGKKNGEDALIWNAKAIFNIY